MPQINNKKNKMKINLKNNNNSKVQVLLKNPITYSTAKDILYAFDSISEASKYLHISYKTLQRHFNINPVQIYGAPDFIKELYGLDEVIWEKSEKFVEIPLEIKNLLLNTKLVEKSKESCLAVLQGVPFSL